MAMQLLIDSLSRCFTGSARSGFRSAARHEEELGRTAFAGGRERVMRNGPNMAGTPREVDSVHGAQRRNRGAIGVSLKEKEWDVLFENNDQRQARAPSSGSSANCRSRANGAAASQRRQMPDMELEYAEVVAQARRAAHPARHRTPTSSAYPRRGSGRKASDIFRSKLRSSKRATRDARPKKRKDKSLSSILLGDDGAMALCFATPIRDEEDDEGSVCTADGENTLNTCDDTMTSTVMFEAKLSHMKEKRPPMPLFRQYQVECTEEKTDELRQIVASDSHKTKLSVVRLAKKAATKKGDAQVLAAVEETPVGINDRDPKTVSAGDKGVGGDEDGDRNRSPRRPVPVGQKENSPSTPPRHPMGGKNELKVMVGQSNDNRKMSPSHSDGAVPSLKVISESSQSTTPSMDRSSEKSFSNTAAMI